MSEHTSTYSLGLGVSLLQRELMGCEPSPCASQTQGAKPSLAKRGRESRSGRTLEPSAWPTPDASEAGKTSRDGDRVDEPLLGGLIREASGSLPLAFPASQPHGPGSNSARQMTAGSGKRLCRSLLPSDPLGDFSRILLESETWASPEFYLTWDVKATRYGCLVWELAPSAPRTGECDTGLFAEGCPTPRSEDSESTGAHRGTPDTLTSAAKLADIAAVEVTDSSTSQTIISANARTAEEAAWPTCDKGMMTRGSRKLSKTGEHHDKVNDLTPRGATTSGCLARTEKFVERLTTLSAWLMGYTAAYLAHWATASSGRSRPKSSRP